MTRELSPQHGARARLFPIDSLRLPDGRTGSGWAVGRRTPHLTVDKWCGWSDSERTGNVPIICAWWDIHTLSSRHDAEFRPRELRCQRVYYQHVAEPIEVPKMSLKDVSPWLESLIGEIAYNIKEYETWYASFRWLGFIFPKKEGTRMKWQSA